MNNQNNYNIKDFKGMNPLDNYILNKNEELTPIYLTKNKNYQINKVLNNINLNINQKNDENNNNTNNINKANENNNIIKTNINDNLVTKNDINKKAAEYKIENINNIFYSKVKKINVNKKKRKKEEKINKFKQLVEEKTVI